MKDRGYPDINNIKPIRELKSPTTKNVEFKFADVVVSKAKSTEYYKYEFNGLSIDLPVVESLSDIQSCFHYYEGDEKHMTGIYMSPYPGVIMQVPFVSVIPYSVENSNYRSVKCKEGSGCKNIHCNYAHPGIDYNKIGCISRCPKTHSFGHKDTIVDDIKSVGIEDIRIVSMYGLNDLFSSALWFSTKYDTNGLRIMHDLEVCDNYSDLKFRDSDES
jgi:hypothetical protein